MHFYKISLVLIVIYVFCISVTHAKYNRVLIINQLSIQEAITTLKSSLLNTGRFTSVTDVSDDAVTSSTLQNIESVFLATDNDWSSYTNLESVLSNFVNNGGGVVSCIQEISVYSLAGSFSSYRVMSTPFTEGEAGTGVALNILNPAHPVMQNVNSFTVTGLITTTSVTLSSGSSLLANWTTAGSVAVAVRDFSPAGRRVDLGFMAFPASDYGIGYTSNEAVTLIANSLVWVQRNCNSTVTITSGCSSYSVSTSSSSCSVSMPDLTSSLTVTGNCDDVVKAQSVTSGTSLSPGSYAVVLNATDGSTSYSCSIFYNVSDSTAPTVTCPSNFTTNSTNCNGTISNIISQVSSSDNCGIASTTQSPSSGTAVTLGTYAITVTVTDTYGNTAQCTTYQTVKDVVAPVIDNCPSSTTTSADSSCSATVPNYLSSFSATDACSSVTYAQSVTAGSTVSTGTTSVTLTATDAAGNSASCRVNYTVNDNTAPVLTQCNSVSQSYSAVSCRAGLTSTTFRSRVNATDNCGSSSLTYTQSPSSGSFSYGNYSVNVTVSDSYGNSVVCQTVFSVTETVTFVVNSLSTTADSTCKSSVSSYSSAASMRVGASQQTSSCALTALYQSPASGTVVGTGNTSVTVVGTSSGGFNFTQSTSFTVTDATAPNITCTETVTSNAGASTCMAALPNLVSGYTSVADNCNISSVTQNTTSGTLFSPGNYSVGVTATDTSSNSASCVTYFVVEDKTAPNITCASSVTENADNTCQAPLPNFAASTNTSDACTASPTVTQNPTAGSTASLGTTSVTVRSTDSVGNFAECVTSYIIVDVTAPNVTCPSTTTLTADASCSVLVPDLIPSFSAVDNCGVTSKSQSPAANTTVTGLSAITVNMTAQDASNNAAHCQATVNVVDTTAPTVTCGATVILTADAFCNVVIPDVTANATTNDNCYGTASTLTQTPVAGTVRTAGNYTITVRATDGSGNFAECTTNLIVLDMTPPTIYSCPAITGIADASCRSNIADFATVVKANDTCGGVTISQLPAQGTQSQQRNSTINIIVTDNSGNIAECTTFYAIVDQTKPDIICVSQTTIIASSTCIGIIPDVAQNATVDDNCDENPDISQSPAALTNTTTVGTNNVTVMATDFYSNWATCVTVVTMIDNIIPTITCTASLSVDVGSTCQAALPNWVNSVTASDNCAFTVTQSPAVGASVALGNSYVQFTARDTYGNQKSCNSTLTAKDVTPPTVTCPSSLTVTELKIPSVTITSSDNCGSVTVTQNPTADTAVTQNGQYTITLTATDASGNTNNCTVAVTVNAQIDIKSSPSNDNGFLLIIILVPVLGCCLLCLLVALLVLLRRRKQKKEEHHQVEMLTAPAQTKQGASTNPMFQDQKAAGRNPMYESQSKAEQKEETSSEEEEDSESTNSSTGEDSSEVSSNVSSDSEKSDSSKR